MTKHPSVAELVDAPEYYGKRLGPSSHAGSNPVAWFLNMKGKRNE